MAYSKQTWTDDVSAVTGARMTHIEQGIYDNSLATDKINPSGTATTTAEIEAGQVTDVIGFKSLKLKGQTSQYTTQGNNLLDIYARHPVGYTETVSGVTFTYNNDGSVNAKGTATADINFFLASNGQLGDDIFNGTNYLSGCTGGSSTTFHLQFWADTIGHFQNTTTEVATNKTAGVNWNITIGIKNGVTIDKTFYPMMSATSGKTFEKYSGGKASPNPDFPQDVNNVSGYNEINICGKNLFDKDNIISGYRLDGSGNPSSSANNEFTSDFIPVESGTTYIRSYGNISAYTRTCFYDKNKSFVSKNDDSQSFTIPINVKYIRFSEYLSKLDTMQLEQGSSATSYIAHQGNNFEINLGKNLIEDTFKGYNINSHGQFETGGTSVDFDVQIARVMQGVTYTITPSTNVIAYFNGKPTTSSTSYNGSREVVTNTNTLTPTKSGYIAIRTATSDTAQLEKGAIATSYAPYFPPIEICKIGTYQDYIYKKDGKWWKHTEFEKLTLKDMNWFLNDNTGLSNTVSHRWAVNHPCSRITNNNMQVTMSNILPMGSANITWGQDVLSIGQSVSQLVIRMPVEYTTVEAMKTALTELNAVGYALLGTPIEKEITYTPLIRQLDEAYNSGLYDNTNISQDNSGEAFILDIEACKNNINGIVEYIRR